MAQEIIRSRVAFQTLTVQGHDTNIMSDWSTRIDLASMRLLAIAAPAGIALGRIDIRTAHKDFGVLAVPYDLIDADEAATLLYLERDLPLFDTTFHVEHVRDEPFELFLIATHR